MATKNKTSETDASVSDFIYSFVDHEQKRKDSFTLIELMREWSGHPPKMWGPSIIGFGRYHYRYTSGREGEAPLIAFSPRKAALTFYITVPGHEDQRLLDQLGRYTKSKACLYVKRLSDIDLKILEKICKTTLTHVRQSPAYPGHL